MSLAASRGRHVSVVKFIDYLLDAVFSQTEKYYLQKSFLAASSSLSSNLISNNSIALVSFFAAGWSDVAMWINFLIRSLLSRGNETLIS